MQAVIMAGGFGTRLRPLTNDLPKPMVPIIDKPIIKYIINNLKKYGITDIIVTLGYKPERIMDYLGDGSKHGVRIRYSVEDIPLGTAGGIKKVASMIDGSFVVISGDALTNIELDGMISHHMSHGKLITMAVKEMDDVSDFGVVRCEDDGTVTSFIEKPTHSLDKLVNTGIYILEKRVFDFIPDGKYDFARELFPNMMDNLSAYRMKEYWSDIGTLSSYYLTNNYVALHPEPFGAVL